MGAETNAQSLSEIKKMNITDLILLDFGLLAERATKILQEPTKDSGDEFLRHAKKSLKSKGIAVTETVKKYPLLAQDVLSDIKNEKMLLDEIDRLSFLLSEGRLNVREQKTNYDSIARKVLAYIDAEKQRMETLPNVMNSDILDEMGTTFLERREFSASDLFSEKQISWKDNLQKLSSRFLDISGNLRH